MVIACVLGVLAGLAGFAPLMFAKRQAIRPDTVFRQQSIPFGLASIGFSFVLLIALMLGYRRFDPENFAGFGIALVATFLLACLVAALSALRRPKH
ncbi:MAG: hypothetical protein LBS58_00750 [Coriobacteriales bacterium]|jgi:hypothetical protein|nr:hypothetical protein [Coriobacteriales bacterium]